MTIDYQEEMMTFTPGNKTYDICEENDTSTSPTCPHGKPALLLPYIMCVFRCITWKKSSSI